FSTRSFGGAAGRTGSGAPRPGGLVPQPQQGQGEIPKTARRMKQPRRWLTCWVCGRSGHVWRICPGPMQEVRVGPGKGTGPQRDNKKSRAAQRRETCWGWQEPGHLKRHCPLRRAERRQEEAPVGPVGPNVAEAVTGMEGTPQEPEAQAVSLCL
uniref:CCHC-type domain-containing protein n=1 Tax=Terrapene triunguis TaxID=2587831 RepID=A0A674K1M9_9SAUR